MTTQFWLVPEYLDFAPTVPEQAGIDLSTQTDIHVGIHDPANPIPTDEYVIYASVVDELPGDCGATEDGRAFGATSAADGRLEVWVASWVPVTPDKDGDVITQQHALTHVLYHVIASRMSVKGEPYPLNEHSTNARSLMHTSVNLETSGLLSSDRKLLKDNFS